MSKVAIISDVHWGARNNHALFLSEAKKFFQDTFFPELQKRGIKDIINLGDLFDSKSTLNSSLMYDINKYYLKPIEEMGENHIIIAGNHDIYYSASSNKVNWLRNLLNPQYHHIVDEHPKRLAIFTGGPISFVPWMSKENRKEILDYIANDNSSILCAHLELAGFQFNKNQKAQYGDDPKLFRKYDRVLSGHYHTKSSKGNITYVGNPYETKKDDEGDPKGFHILDTATFQLEFIQNPRTVHETIVYDISLPYKEPERYAGKILEFLILDNNLLLDYEERMIPFLKTIQYESVLMQHPDSLTTTSAGKVQQIDLRSDASMSEIFEEYLDTQTFAIASKRDLYSKKLNELYERVTTA